MIKAGVIGHPIAHSKSPKIHGYWLKTLGIDGEYTAIDIAPEELIAKVDRLVADGFAGFNVTIPHKQAIIPLCAALSPEAAAIGAVNTVVIRADGTLYGHNTDAFGFVANLEERLPDFDWAAGPAVVVGAGGAARAILWALRNKGVPVIRLTNRTRAKAEELAAEFGAEVIDWDRRSQILEDVQLLVNTSSLGMAAQPALDLDVANLPVTATVYDIVYNPLMTPLLQNAATNNCRIVTGIGMLLHQARPAFAAWFGQTPTVTSDLRDLL